ncbi:hypothetical protein QWJ34_09840 [Saccharibacillus sp. CPCC 101409]|uniref:hypothetical protein n=1 Tax=Saccharibacillus sp. CPCC 101409 TaxID=3058041 RepID=UPI002672B742|nr:hypothetical protein [Saccharibacillus sp. CPCC 101409]MDO3410061.1 hypothetical protein [Saccharibacillus sp. CPCC 101409]
MSFSPISSLSKLPAMNGSYTPSRQGKAPLENRKTSLEVELSRVLQMPESVADREQRAMRLRRHIALLERHIALLDAANGERPEFTVQGRQEHEGSEHREQPEFSLPEEPEEPQTREGTSSAAHSELMRKGGELARAAFASFDAPGSLYAAPPTAGAVQPWESHKPPAQAAKLGRNFDVSV